MLLYQHAAREHLAAPVHPANAESLSGSSVNVSG
jgi:hypothetical protein